MEQISNSMKIYEKLSTVLRIPTLNEFQKHSPISGGTVVNYAPSYAHAKVGGRFLNLKGKGVASW